MRRKIIAILDIIFCKGFWLLHTDKDDLLYRCNNSKFKVKHLIRAKKDIEDQVQSELEQLTEQSAVDEVNKIINQSK